MAHDNLRRKAWTTVPSPRAVGADTTRATPTAAVGRDFLEACRAAVSPVDDVTDPVTGESVTGEWVGGRWAREERGGRPPGTTGFPVAWSTWRTRRSTDG